MKTGDLIRALAADREASSQSTDRLLLIAIPIGLAVSLMPFLLLIGLRPNLADAAATVPFMLKPVEMLILTTAAAALVLRLAQPGAPWRRAALAAALAPALMIAAVIVELLVVPRAEWLVRLAGAHWHICVVNMVLLALPMLAAILIGLRAGAPTRPALAGAGAGLLAGALSATLYIAHCPDDSPLFVAAWFTSAIAIVTAIGSTIGARLLRW
jgi:hypothetical protein